MDVKNQWIRQPQETENQNYTFSGQCVITHRVNKELSELEVISIVQEIKTLVYEKGGLDYLQVFKKGDQKLYCIDQIASEMKNENHYTPEQLKEYDYWTILFAEEY